MLVYYSSVSGRKLKTSPIESFLEVHRPQLTLLGLGIKGADTA